MQDDRVRRAGLVIGIVAVAAGLYGAFVAGSSDRGEVVGIVDLKLNLYAVNTTGGLVLAGIGILAVIAVLSRTPVPMWTASGIAGLMALYGLLAWRDDTGNSLGFDGRTISLLLGLCLSFAALACGLAPADLSLDRVPAWTTNRSATRSTARPHHHAGPPRQAERVHRTMMRELIDAFDRADADDACAS